MRHSDGICVGWRLLVACAVAFILLGSAPRTEHPPGLSVSGPRLALAGRPTFLVGVSLFDALGGTPPTNEDLDALESWGVRVVRVWAHWSEPIYGADGSLTRQGRTRLASLAARLRTRRLILELVLLRPGQLAGQRFAV